MDYGKVASKEGIERAVKALERRGFKPVVVANGKEALEYINRTIPKGASVMNGSSVTLEEVGFVDLLKSGKHEWDNLHAAILEEEDSGKRSQLRKYSVVSEYYLGSVHALTEDGEMVIASNTGSQQPHLVFTSPNLILVVGAQKIVPGLPEAFDRLEKYVMPLEDEHMKRLYGVGTALNKTVILHGESNMTKRFATVILVSEKVGF